MTGYQVSVCIAKQVGIFLLSAFLITCYFISMSTNCVGVLYK